MSRICIVGDAHFRTSLPYASVIRDARQHEWDMVKKTIHETAESCNAIVLLGDNLNLRNNASAVLKEFVEFLKMFGSKPVYLIVGNHERTGFSTALDFLQKIDTPNWYVFTEISTVKIHDLTASFIPYMTPGVIETEDIEAATKKILGMLPGGDILFHHHAMTGAKWNGGAAEYLNEIVLPRETLEDKYQWIFGGHIHHPQKFSERVYGTGSILTQEIGEHEKFVWVLDTDTKVVSPVSLPVRGIYNIDLDTTTLPDLMHIPSSSIVKCTVTNRDIPIELVENALQRFDAHIIVEHYPNERVRVALDASGSLDLSIENLLKIYAGAKMVSYEDLRETFASLAYPKT